jgi:hypothetical protein
MSHNKVYLLMLGTIIGVALLIIFSGGNCLAQENPPAQIVRVEEDWKMILEQPEPESVAPQVTCVISPVDNVNSLHAALTLNHHGLPDFTPGGMQLQIWNNETSMLNNNNPNNAVLSQTDEIVSWTQSMELKEGALTFEVINGSSATWGEFGGQGYLKAVVNTTLENLNNYSPDVSVGNSGIGFASNRVHVLVLDKVRYITSTGAVIEDDTQRIIHYQE